jgi:hypothetical protein
MANEQNTQGNAPEVKAVFSIEVMEGFYNGIIADEKASQEALANATKARLPSLYSSFENCSETDFRLIVKQWKEKHKKDRSAAVRVSECTALFFAFRRVNAQFPDQGYHRAVASARQALKDAGYRVNGDKELSEDQRKFNAIKNAKQKARKELEAELGDKYFTMDDGEIAEMLRTRVKRILDPQHVPMDEAAKEEVLSAGPVHAMEHAIALAKALGANVVSEGGVIRIELPEDQIRELEEQPEEKQEEEKQ